MRDRVMNEDGSFSYIGEEKCRVGDELDLAKGKKLKEEILKKTSLPHSAMVHGSIAEPVGRVVEKPRGDRIINKAGEFVRLDKRKVVVGDELELKRGAIYKKKVNDRVAKEIVKGRRMEREAILKGEK